MQRDKRLALGTGLNSDSASPVQAWVTNLGRSVREIGEVALLAVVSLIARPIPLSAFWHEPDPAPVAGRQSTVIAELVNPTRERLKDGLAGRAADRLETWCPAPIDDHLTFAFAVVFARLLELSPVPTLRHFAPVGPSLLGA